MVIACNNVLSMWHGVVEVLAMENGLRNRGWSALVSTGQQHMPMIVIIDYSAACTTAEQWSRYMGEWCDEAVVV